MHKAVAHHALIFLILFSAHSAFPQKFSIGPKAGPLVMWARLGEKDAREEFSSLPTFGFYAGGFINFPMKKDYSFQSEAGYSLRGKRMKFNSDTWENKATYNFVDVSMMLRRGFHFELGPDIPAEWFLEVGPRISYWLNGHGKFGVAGDPRSEYTVVFNRPADGDFYNMYLNDVNRWLFGLDLGVGFFAPIMSSQKVFTELRFTLGHTYYGQKYGALNNTLGFTDNLEANEKMICLSVSYDFDFDLRKSKMGRSTKDKEIKRKR